MQKELKYTTQELSTKISAWYKLSQGMNSAGEKMKSVGDKMSSIGSRLATAVSLPLIGIGTAATKMAMGAVESENLYEVAMGSMAGDARVWWSISLSSVMKGIILTSWFIIFLNRHPEIEARNIFQLKD